MGQCTKNERQSKKKDRLRTFLSQDLMTYEVRLRAKLLDYTICGLVRADILYSLKLHSATSNVERLLNTILQVSLELSRGRVHYLEGICGSVKWKRRLSYIAYKLVMQRLGAVVKLRRIIASDSCLRHLGAGYKEEEEDWFVQLREL